MANYALLAVIFVSLLFIIKGAKGIHDKRILFNNPYASGFIEYSKMSAMAPSVVMLLIGTLPYFLFISSLISNFFNNELLNPIIILSLIPITWALIIYLSFRAKKK